MTAHPRASRKCLHFARFHDANLTGFPRRDVARRRRRCANRKSKGTGQEGAGGGDSGAASPRAECIPRTQKKEGTTASRALRYCLLPLPKLRSTVTTLCLALPWTLACTVGLSDGAANSALASSPTV